MYYSKSMDNIIWVEQKADCMQRCFICDKQLKRRAYQFCELDTWGCVEVGNDCVDKFRATHNVIKCNPDCQYASQCFQFRTGGCGYAK